MGVRVLDVIRDEGVSGALYYTREGIQKALNHLELGAASILIVAKLDRAGRDVDALRDIRRRVNKVGELVFADGVQFAANATGNSCSTSTAVLPNTRKKQLRNDYTAEPDNAPNRENSPAATVRRSDTTSRNLTMWYAEPIPPSR